MSAAMRAAGAASAVKKRKPGALSPAFLRRQALVLDQIADFIFVVDLDNVFVDVNRRAAEMFGPAKADLIGRESWTLVDDPAADKAENRAEAQRHYAAGTPYKRELWCRAADGRRRLIELTSVALRDDDERMMGQITIGRDVTDRDALETELRRAETMKALGQISGGIAHDFNNLLGVIGGSIELAADAVQDDARARKALDRALRATQMAADLVTRLQTFSHQKPIAPRPGNLRAALDELLPRVSGGMRNTVAVTADIPADLWPAVFDAAQLAGVLASLAGNANDAMPQGGALVVTARNVTVGGPDAADRLAAGDYVSIAVADTGTGMAAAVKDHAFDPFFSTKPAGSGLGLTLVADFARQCGGHVAIDSVMGRGTTVRLLLPRASVAASVAAAPDAAPTAGPGGKVILVVEDEDELRAVTVDRLRALGHTVLEAVDADLALGIMSGAARIDLMLSDVILGSGMNGRQLAEAAVKLRPDLKVILCTGYAAAALQGQAPVPWKVLQKPIAARALAEAIADALQL